MRKLDIKKSQIFKRLNKPTQKPKKPSLIGEHKKLLKDRRIKLVDKAHRIYNRAKRTGQLAPQSCEICGASKSIHGHHEDYRKPLEVRWLCATHHAKKHQEQKNGFR